MKRPMRTNPTVNGMGTWLCAMVKHAAQARRLEIPFARRERTEVVLGRKITESELSIAPNPQPFFYIKTAMKRFNPLSRVSRFLARTLALAAASGLIAQAPKRPDIVVADFEGGTYGDWKVEGEAFGHGPARAKLPGQMKVDGFLGRGLVNSFHGGDKSTGRLMLPRFTVERRFITFLFARGAAGPLTS
ncbi:MAG: Levanase precursor [Verrucomicrobiota bacterium]